MRTIAVVIPYFQREVAPLRRALLSVQAQACRDRCQVIIVDDASPVPAQAVLSELGGALDLDVQVLRQKNAGAASARNAALDRLPLETALVAFLDSDDVWSPSHLETALRALEDPQADVDFYFSDHQRSDWDESKFARIGHEPDPRDCMDAERRLFTFKTLSADAVMRRHIIQTSTVVCRAALVRRRRFPTDLVLGEDEVFWMQMLREARGGAFSMHLGVSMGKGVNISQGGAWGDLRSVQLLLQNIAYWQDVERHLPDTPDLPALRAQRLGQLRTELIRTALHRLRRLQTVPARAIAAGLWRCRA